MKFQGKNTTELKLINSIMRFYNEATVEELSAGIYWYSQAYNLAKELSIKFGLSIIQSAGVISALSPQTSWELNKVFALRFLRDGMSAKTSTEANKLKALKCMTATSFNEVKAILNGNKTVSFFINIADPTADGIATIDRHAFAVCTQHPKKVKPIKKPVKLTSRQYQALEMAYSKSAQKLGIRACELQAITWVTYRRIRGLK